MGPAEPKGDSGTPTWGRCTRLGGPAVNGHITLGETAGKWCTRAGRGMVARGACATISWHYVRPPCRASPAILNNLRESGARASQIPGAAIRRGHRPAARSSHQGGTDTNGPASGRQRARTCDLDGGPARLHCHGRCGRPPCGRLRTPARAGPWPLWQRLDSTAGACQRRRLQHARPPPLGRPSWLRRPMPLKTRGGWAHVDLLGPRPLTGLRPLGLLLRPNVLVNNCANATRTNASGGRAVFLPQDRDLVNHRAPARQQPLGQCLKPLNSSRHERLHANLPP